MHTLGYGLIIFLVATFLVPFISDRFKAQVFIFLALLTAIVETYALAPVFGDQLALDGQIWFGWPLGQATIHLDRMGAFFYLIIAWFSLPILAFTREFVFSKRKNTSASHWVLIGILLLAMRLVLMFDSLIHFLVAWEAMSLASFFLVALGDGTRQNRLSALHYFIAMHVSVIFLMLGTVLFPESQMNFSDLAQLPMAGLSLFFLMVGFAVKVGLTPFHSWMPEAYPAASPDVSAIMSALMSKIGVYGMLRVVLAFKDSSLILAWVVLVLGALTAVAGVVFAILRRDAKEILAYSSMENLGIITMGIGLILMGGATDNGLMLGAGLAAVLFHTLLHSFSKIVLFIAMGLIERAGGGRDLEKMGGLAKRAPQIAQFFFPTAWSSANLPPFGGLVSEVLLIIALLSGVTIAEPLATSGLVMVLASLGATSGIALLLWGKFWGIAFSGEPRSVTVDALSIERKSKTYSLWILVGGLLFLGLMPALVFEWLEPIMDEIVTSFMSSFSVQASWPVTKLSLISSLNSIALVSMIFLALTMALLLFRYLLLRKRSQSVRTTWACGWQRPDPKIQYSAGSFSAPLVEVVKPILHSEKREVPVAGYFPQQAESHHSLDDPLRRTIKMGSRQMVARFFPRFAMIQSGNMQRYILFGLIWLLAMIVWVMVRS